MSECYACRCDQEVKAPSLAFLAGIAFAGSFNAEAMKAKLCQAHLAMLERGWAGAMPAVKPHERRKL